MFSVVANAQVGHKLYGGQGYTANIVVYDAATLDSINFIAGAGGYRIAYCAPLNKVYSTGAGDLVTVINALTDQIITEIDLDTLGVFASEVEGITITPDGSTVYVADEQGSGAIWAISTATDQVMMTNTLAVDEPENLCISPDGAFLYMADNSEVHKISTATLTIVASAPTGGDGHGVTISPDGAVVYAQSSSGVTAYDATSLAVIGSWSANGYSMEYDPIANLVLCASEGNYVDVLDPALGNIDQINLSSGGAAGIAVSGDGSVYYIATSGGIYSVDANTLVALDSNQLYSLQSVIMLPMGTNAIGEPVEEGEGLVIAPNPANDAITVRGIGSNALVEVVDAMGQRVVTVRSNSLDVSTWSEGVYFLKAEGRTQRLMLSR